MPTTNLELKKYQSRSLQRLTDYLDLATRDGAKRAFIAITEQVYHSVPTLPDLPYVCLRVPTGGGKTLMASHAVGMVIRKYLKQSHALCLWLVPSDPILTQTLTRLRDVQDPYHQALRASVGDGDVTILSLDEALAVTRETLDGDTVVVVSTLAAIRIEEREERKFYKQNGALASNFAGLSKEQRDRLEHTAEGHLVESLANVFKLRRPVVIVDEAHNARTPLSFETLSRLNPSFVLEFTATPAAVHRPEADKHASNVLAHVSAAELKAEQMVKLPIKLVARPVWTDAVSDAVAMQRELEAVAARERTMTGERIRPIVLVHAQPQSQEQSNITAEVLEQALINDFRIPREQIAVETTGRADLSEIDIMDADCPVRFVITVQKLREGWDCPWAYVLCSVGELSSKQAVEQMLGRVLRMPRATRKREAKLNYAYAFVVSPQFVLAAQHLKDALVVNGFQRFEVEDLVDEPRQTWLFDQPGPGVSEQIEEAPRLDRLPSHVQEVVRFDPQTMTLTMTAPVAPADAELIKAVFSTPAAREVVERLQAAAEGLESVTSTPATAVPRPPRTRGLIRIPQLAVEVQGELLEFASSPWMEYTWKIADRDAVLTSSHFAVGAQITQAGHVDVDAQGEVRWSAQHQEEVAEQLAELEGEGGWTIPALAVWLDNQIPHPDLDRADVQLFIHRALEALVAREDLDLTQVAKHKFRLRDALATRIDGLRAEQRRQVFQAALFGPEAAPVVTSGAMSIAIGNPDDYAPSTVYQPGMEFRKHLFRQVGDLKSEGEEFQCAAYLDSHSKVKYWVRNLERRPETSFWLPTSTDRFYPDFVGELLDGRIFAVEYKGAHLWSGDDAKEKRAVGALWAERSASPRCVFVMPNGPDWQAIEAAFA